MLFTAKLLQIYFDKSFIEMFLKFFFISDILFGQLLIFIGCHRNQNAKKMEKILK